MLFHDSWASLAYLLHVPNDFLDFRGALFLAMNVIVMITLSIGMIKQSCMIEGAYKERSFMFLLVF